LVEARAILLPGDKELDEMEMEEYEFDILWDNNKEAWVAHLIPGSYLVTVKA